MNSEKKTVTLLQYDISNGMAKSLSPFFLGKTIEAIWHTSLVVYDKEYYYGGGICRDFPKCTPYGIPIKETEFGFTEIPEELFEEYLNEISERYHMGTYHILNNNCNHFTNEICIFLTGMPLPDSILNQHQEIANTGLGKYILPMLEKMSADNNQFLPQSFENQEKNDYMSNLSPANKCEAGRNETEVTTSSENSEQEQFDDNIFNLEELLGKNITIDSNDDNIFEDNTSEKSKESDFPSEMEYVITTSEGMKIKFVNCFGDQIPAPQNNLLHLVHSPPQWAQKYSFYSHQ